MTVVLRTAKTFVLALIVLDIGTGVYQYYRQTHPKK